MLGFLKSAAKPAFMVALGAAVDARWALWRPGKPHGLPARLIVSLTSYPKRFDVLAPTLKTLLTQSVAPDAVVLWIAHQDVAALPPEVRKLESQGLVIRATDDLQSYKKIIPALAEYGDAFIITADDDVYYPRGWLETFTTAYVPGEKAALSYRAHRMIFSGRGLAPYSDWIFEIAELAPGNEVFFTGVGGVLYPPGLLHPDVMNVDLLRELCPRGDDIWLNWMVRLNGGTVRKVGPKQRFYEWPGSQGSALQNNNLANGGNDQQLARIIEVYGIPGVKP